MPYDHHEFSFFSLTVQTSLQSAPIREKLGILKMLDEEILNFIEEETDISWEIEQADKFKERIDMQQPLTLTSAVSMLANTY